MKIFDPNTALSYQRARVAEIENDWPDGTTSLAHRQAWEDQVSTLLDTVRALDFYMSNGGEGPADWVAASVIAKAKTRAREARQ